MRSFIVHRCIENRWAPYLPARLHGHSFLQPCSLGRLCRAVCSNEQVVFADYCAFFGIILPNNCSLGDPKLQSFVCNQILMHATGICANMLLIIRTGLNIQSFCGASAPPAHNRDDSRCDHFALVVCSLRILDRPVGGSFLKLLLCDDGRNIHLCQHIDGPPASVQFGFCSSQTVLRDILPVGLLSRQLWFSRTCHWHSPQRFGGPPQPRRASKLLFHQ